MERPDLTAHAVICDVIADAFDISKSSASADAETVIVCLRDHGWEITRRAASHLESGAPAEPSEAKLEAVAMELRLIAQRANAGRAPWSQISDESKRTWIEEAKRILYLPEPTPEPIQGGAQA